MNDQCPRTKPALHGVIAHRPLIKSRFIRPLTGLISSTTIRPMSFIGHGIDIVETNRIREMLVEHGQRFLDRCFTPAEQAYCDASKKRRIEHLAGRFAAKEAILKVIGTGWRGGIAWTDMEILNAESGQPQLTLSGETKAIAEKLGITRWMVSISHIETHATASAIGLGE